MSDAVGANNTVQEQPLFAIDDECAVQIVKDDFSDEGFAAVRSDSYSSVKEDADGQPQSFFSSSPRKDTRSNSAFIGELLTQAPHAPQQRGNAPGRTLSLERLPVEIIYRIFSNLALDVPPNDYTPRNRDLVSCLTVSRSFHPLAAAVLYRHVTFPHSLVFAKFLKFLRHQPEVGMLIRRLDLSHFNSLGFGRTRKDNEEAQYFTAKSLKQCLDLIPRVQEILLQEHVDENLDAEALMKIFFELPLIRAVDLCGAHRGPFVDAFSETMDVLRTEPQKMLHLQRLSLHQCDTLSSQDISTLLSRLPRLHMLDLFHTRVEDDALMSIPHTADLTHLNLGRCSQITGPGVVEFLSQHPAAKNLRWLNLACDISTYRLLRETDVDALLPSLPTTLRSLNLNGAKISSSHLPQIRRLVSHLEELGLSNCKLSLAEIRSLFEVSDLDEEAEHFFSGSSLRYIDLSGVESVDKAALFRRTSVLLSPATRPLEVIEISTPLATSLVFSKQTSGRLGWTKKEFGRRSWWVREDRGEKPEDPARSWKMGSKWWGMKKVPVASSEVGGIYGHYMFKA